ncbi:MAG: HAMP domain-containing sensor histidine kinase [Bacilli bacterium]|nr:HAMP domain-containing sensor histidine kinase [Bacilli bacterium]
MNELVEKIINIDNTNVIESMDDITLDNNICLEYMDYYGNTYYYNNKISSCLLGHNKIIDKELIKFKQSGEETSFEKILNPINNSISLLYGIKKGNGYIFLFTSLEDIGTTTSLIKNQLIYVTLLAILFSIVIAMFLSRRIAKPISDMTKNAKILADGNYDVKFTTTGIKEIDELANTLNYLEQEVSKTDEYRRDLMANVSHDLKTPLTMIKAYAEMIRDITLDNKEKTKENLNVIIDETNRLNILVNDILELSKLQNNQETLNIEKFDIVELIRDILKRYQIIKETENYNLILESPQSIIVKADKKRISQVIYNLINNAINYTGDDLKVTIRITENQKDCKIEIIDTGKGIDEKDLPNIWNRYYKKEKNHKRNVVGTGLGLSIVKNILEQHNFKYGVNSIKNKGTTFYFQIKK